MLQDDIDNKKQLILVDKDDNEIGVEEKIKAHEDCALHRAFSVLIFNNNNEVLLQQRHMDKYHSGGLWANTCCSHPYPNEDIEDAAHRRLQEELGFDTKLTFVKKVYYKTEELENNLYEHEIVHVFIGKIDEYIGAINEREVQDVKWMDIDTFIEDLEQRPDLYTYWIKQYIKEINFKEEVSKLA